MRGAARHYGEPGPRLRANGFGGDGLGNLVNLWVDPRIPPCRAIVADIGRGHVPKLSLHAVEDDVVSFTAELTLFAPEPEPKALVLLSGGHGKMVEREPEWHATTSSAWLDAVVGK